MPASSYENLLHPIDVLNHENVARKLKYFSKALIQCPYICFRKTKFCYTMFVKTFGSAVYGVNAYTITIEFNVSGDCAGYSLCLLYTSRCV